MGVFVGAKLERLAGWLTQFGWAKVEKLLLVVVTCLIFLWAVGLVSKAVRRAVDDGDESVTTEAERRAETLGAVIKNAARVLVVIFLVLMILQEFGVNIQPLLAGSAVAGVALGFGAQALVKDVIAGFFLLLENQFAVGDIISLGERTNGTVERMTLRVTVIRDSEGRAHYVPNGNISQVTVLSKQYARALVDVEVSSEVDAERAMEILRELGQQLPKDLPGKASEATEVLGIESMNASGFVLRTLTKTAPGAQWDVAREFRRRVLSRFRAEGLPLAVPQQVVWNRSQGSAGTAVDGEA